MLGNRLANAYYWYNDEYMYFSFNGHHSSKYHLFMQNNKQLTIENAVGSAVEYTNAMMQEGTYYLGTSRKQKTFKRKCAAEGLTLEDYRRMMNWLTVGATGELVFDSDRYWGWTVVLDTIGDATFYGNNNSLTIEFELTFKTVGSYLAHSVYPANWFQPRSRFKEDGTIDTPAYDNNEAYIDVIGTNKYHIPTVLANYKYSSMTSTDYSAKAEVGFLILDICNKKQDFTFAFTASDLNGNCNFKIEHDAKTYAEGILSDSNNQGNFGYIEYNSEKSTLYVNDGVMDQNEYCEDTHQLNGILQLNSFEPLELYTTKIEKDSTTNKINITLDDDSWNDFCSGEYDYIVLSIKNANNTLYSLDNYSTLTESYQADYISYTGLQSNMYNKLNEINPTSNYNCNYVGKYNKLDTTKQIQLDIVPNASINLNNNYVVYCGYAKYLKTTLQINNTSITNIPFSIKVVSYNNL